MNSIIEFLTKIFNSNVFNLLLGSILTFCFSCFLNKQKRNQTLEDKIIEKRIAAYEEIYNVISPLLVFSYSKDDISPKECNFKKMDSKLTSSNIKKILGVPQPFITIESIRQYNGLLANTLNKKRIYLDDIIYKKVHFLNSYVGQCWDISVNKNNKYLIMMGTVLADEIESMVTAIEIEIQNYFKIDSLKNHKNSIINSQYNYIFESRKQTKLFKMFIKKGENPENMVILKNVNHVHIQ